MSQTKGMRIKSLRLEQGLTQLELANKIGISKQTMSKYEKDIVTNIPSDKLELLARALHSTEMYILGYETQKNNDAIADIIIKMRSDDSFFHLVRELSTLNDAQIEGVSQFLNAFLK